MRESLVFASLVMPLMALAVVLYLFDRTRRREALYRWASGLRLNLLSARQPWLTEFSAFPVSLSKSQQVFRVHVEMQDGNRRSGWVSLGSAWLGLGSSQAEVKWDSA